ncbi:hypothetical protein BOTBODRAFT_544857 [Botryobasidium botryosum FD-172 SS1]|uniref:Uncharacterized protein n=1 Tax=Botryobasidium botryosum (strain FD-172 SS1) TaxID=930990 RepID=A0A067MQV6_BOTB1|nr:hypothetical protein BOTBODRAFT_544857 [Botryobasidium botryosum FD-172 SS1]
MLTLARIPSPFSPFRVNRPRLRLPRRPPIPPRHLPLRRNACCNHPRVAPLPVLGLCFTRAALRLCDPHPATRRLYHRTGGGQRCIAEGSTYPVQHKIHERL